MVLSDDAMRQTVSGRRAALLREAEGERLARLANAEATGANAIGRALALLRLPHLRGGPLRPAPVAPEREA